MAPLTSERKQKVTKVMVTRLANQSVKNQSQGEGFFKNLVTAFIAAFSSKQVVAVGCVG